MMFLVIILSAINPALCIQTSFISTGNSITGGTGAEYHEYIMNEKNADQLSDKYMSFTANDSINDKYDSIYLHQPNSSNILDSSGSFNIDLVIPQGKNFTFRINLLNLFGISGSNVNIEITMPDGTIRSITITASDAGIGLGNVSFYITYDNISDTVGKVTSFDDFGNKWFQGSSEDYSIKINGNQYLKLEFEILFEK